MFFVFYGKSDFEIYQIISFPNCEIKLFCFLKVQ